MDDGVVIVPLRSDLPVGARFKFKGKRNVYEIVEADVADGIACEACAFNSRKRFKECMSLFCRPKLRADKKTVYAVKEK